MQLTVDGLVHGLLRKNLSDLENLLDGDILYYYGTLANGYEKYFRDNVEELATKPSQKSRLFVVLTTPGGVITSVKRYVNILRYHYEEVNFIVPDQAYSAGTIFCMSGDKIYMDYSSVLGPIDPQVQSKDGKYVAALGYLDKVNEMIEKSGKGTLTEAEFLMFREIDLAELRGYEQARDLAVDLLKEWLVKYKFKNWNIHRTNPKYIGKPVTKRQKVKRAEEIAKALSDNSRWKSHGRPIDIKTLVELRLEIEDYSKDKALLDTIRSYHGLLVDFVKRENYPIFIHTKYF